LSHKKAQKAQVKKANGKVHLIRGQPLHDDLFVLFGGEKG